MYPPPETIGWVAVAGLDIHVGEGACNGADVGWNVWCWTKIIKVKEPKKICSQRNYNWQWGESGFVPHVPPSERNLQFLEENLWADCLQQARNVDHWDLDKCSPQRELLFQDFALTFHKKDAANLSCHIAYQDSTFFMANENSYYKKSSFRTYYWNKKKFKIKTKQLQSYFAKAPHTTEQKQRLHHPFENKRNLLS